MHIRQATRQKAAGLINRMSMMDDVTMRVRALELAIQVSDTVSRPDEIVKAAEIFRAFLCAETENARSS